MRLPVSCSGCVDIVYSIICEQKVIARESRVFFEESVDAGFRFDHPHVARYLIAIKSVQKFVFLARDYHGFDPKVREAENGNAFGLKGTHQTH